MWQILNKTLFLAERTFLREINGAEKWIVSVKCTFMIDNNGFNKIAKEQVEINHTPVYSVKAGHSSLLYDSDFVLNKPNSDIILNAHAYSPIGIPQKKVDVFIKVGNLKKGLTVYGDRYWKKTSLGIKMSEPEPFIKMPIIYERAFGGFDKKSKDSEFPTMYRQNPVGTGFAEIKKNVIGKRLPNIEYPSETISNWNDKPIPAGYSAIASNWGTRLKYAGTYDSKWKKERYPLLPLDFDYRFYQCAPEDQQTREYLNGGELVELFNLTPNGYLSFKLPDAGKWLSFFTEFDTESVEHKANLHTVIIEPDYPRVIMVWSTSIICHNKDHLLKRTIVE